MTYVSVFQTCLTERPSTLSIQTKGHQVHLLMQHSKACRTKSKGKQDIMKKKFETTQRMVGIVLGSKSCHVLGRTNQNLQSKRCDCKQRTFCDTLGLGYFWTTSFWMA